jgi:hypothetical protein
MELPTVAIGKRSSPQEQRTVECRLTSFSVVLAGDYVLVPRSPVYLLLRTPGSVRVCIYSSTLYL